MRETTLNLLRGLCLAAILSAGSCTVPFTKDADNFDDPAANHPLLVEPSYQSMKLSYASGNLNPADASKLDAFIEAIDRAAILETVRTGTSGIGRGERILRV